LDFTKKSKFLRRLGVQSAGNFAGTLGGMKELYTAGIVIFAEKARLQFIPRTSRTRFIATNAGGAMDGTRRRTDGILILLGRFLSNFTNFNWKFRVCRFLINAVSIRNTPIILGTIKMFIFLLLVFIVRMFYMGVGL
jgi:hypothetical protein